MKNLVELWNKKYVSNQDIKHLDYSFLPPEIQNGNPRQIIWHLINNHYDIVRCNHCNNPVTWNITCRSYRKYCSIKCASQTDDVKEKRKQTTLKKYGVEHVLKSGEFKEKLKKTNIEKYGVENPAQNNEVQQKIKQTNIEKYGTDNPFGNKEIQEKIKQTNMEKYGTENPSSNKDIQDKRKHTILEKYGVEYLFSSGIIQEKIKQSNIDKYGTENPFGSKEIQEKIKQTNLEKYGVEYLLQSMEIQEKIKQTNLEKYGVENPFGSKEIQEKIKQTNMEKYGTPFSSQIHLSRDTIEILNNKEKFSNFIKEKSAYEIYNDLGIHQTSFNGLIKRYEVHDLYQKRGPSSLEVEMAKFLDDLDINYEKNNRTVLRGKELDFYIPDYNIAIEMNGVYWHSDKYISDKNYHYDKWKMCYNFGIHLLSIFEDDWIDKNAKIKNMIKDHLGLNKIIFTNNIQIKNIDSSLAKPFLKKYHLNGYADGTTIHYGAFDEKNNMIAVMTFDHINYDDDDDNVLVLNRFVNSEYNYTKLFTELFKYAQKDLKFSKVISYSDNTFFKCDDVYKKNGFDISKIHDPEYSYQYKDKRIQKQDLTENELKFIFPQLTKHIKNGIKENEVIEFLDIPKIYDCGKCEWIWKIQEK